MENPEEIEQKTLSPSTINVPVTCHANNYPCKIQFACELLLKFS